MNEHNRYDFELERYQFQDNGNTVLLIFDGRPKIEIPKKSLKPFIQDLSIDYSDMELSGYPHIDNIIEGNATFLGKGFDGMVFKSLGDVVKVSTTVPFHPTEQMHRTPEQAIEHTRKEAKVLKELQGKVSCVLPIEYIEHSGRAWIIKPYLKLIDDSELTKEQYDSLEDCIYALHSNGYAIGDTLQYGIGLDGNVYFMDLGQSETEERYMKDDLDNLRDIALKAGYTSRRSELASKEALRLLKLLYIFARRYNFDIDKVMDDDKLFDRYLELKDNFDDVYYSLPKIVRDYVNQDPMKQQLNANTFTMD